MPMFSDVPLLPAIHRLVTITDHDGRGYCSRIEDVGEGFLVLARPLTLPVEHEFEIGRSLTVSWPDPEGLTMASVELVATRIREHLGLWLTRIEELYRQQRRQFVRVAALGTVELVGIGEPGEPFAHVAGHLLDLSEAALRCSLQTPDAEALCTATSLLASFPLGEDRFTVPASMLRGEPSRRAEQVTECVLTFDIDESEAAELRRRVFGEQVQARRRQLRTEAR
jgi:c-di-GMP-binding flagellar brake protein YcgR